MESGEKTSASIHAGDQPQGGNTLPTIVAKNQHPEIESSSAFSNPYGGLFTGSLFAIVPLLLMAVA